MVVYEFLKVFSLLTAAGKVVVEESGCSKIMSVLCRDIIDVLFVVLKFYIFIFICTACVI